MDGIKRYNRLYRNNPRLVDQCERPLKQAWFPDAEFDVITRNIRIKQEINTLLEDEVDAISRARLIRRLQEYHKPARFLILQAVLEYFYPKKTSYMHHDEMVFNAVCRRIGELYDKTPSPNTPGVIVA